MGGNYVSLHNHTHYSELDGLATPEEYLVRAKELGQTAFGITDHGTLAGVYESIQAAKKHDLTLIPGVEAYVAPRNPLGAKEREPVFYGRDDQRDSDVSARGSYLHLSMWAYNNEGLKNLYRLSEYAGRAEHKRQKGRVDLDALAENSEGIIVSTGCPSSEVSTRFRLGQDREALEYTGILTDIYGSENVFIEVMNHRMSTRLETDLLEKQKWLSERFPKLGLLATNDCHYAYPEHAKHHEEFLAAQSGSRMSDKTYDEGGRRFAFDGVDYYLKDQYEMAELFPESEYPGALKNTLHIAERAQDITIDYDAGLRPTVPIPEGFNNEEMYFRHLVYSGLEWRYPSLFRYENGKLRELSTDSFVNVLKNAVKKEYETFRSSDFIGYFLTVHEYVDWTNEEHSIKDPKTGRVIVSATGAGRGSAAGSLISYLLGITRVPPIEYGLIFERFMTPGRGATIEITYEDNHKELKNAGDLVDMGRGKKYAHRVKAGDHVAISDHVDKGGHC